MLKGLLKASTRVNRTGLSLSINISPGTNIYKFPWVISSHGLCTSRGSESESNPTTTSKQSPKQKAGYLDASDNETEDVMIKDMLIYEDFLSCEEEKNILDEIEPYLSRVKYEYSHWDGAIHGYRETEKRHWTSKNKAVLERVKEIAFPPTVAALAYVHILDLAEDGVIKPHVDAVRFCGDTIAGLSLLSQCVMKLVHEKNKDHFSHVFVPRRSLYIMRNKARYDYTHEVLSNESSFFRGEPVHKSRRISVICRNEPTQETN